MSDDQPEESSHPWEDDSDPRFDVWLHNQFTCMTFDGQLGRHQGYHIQRDHKQGSQITLPSISQYSMADHLHFAPDSSTTLSYIAKPDASADPALASLPPRQTASFQQGFHDNGLHQGHKTSGIANNEGVYSQYCFRPSLTVFIDESHAQQVSGYYWDTHPPGLRQPITSSAYSGSIPSKLRHRPSQSTSSSLAYPLPTIQETSSTLSKSPYEVSQSMKSCSICGENFACKAHLQSHFEACVTRKGNSAGARGHDGVQGKGELYHGDKEGSMWERCDTGPTIRDNQLSASASRPSQPSPALMAKRAARMRRMHSRLNAVNGVVIPSKLAEGQVPVKVRSHTHGNKPLRLFCPRCKGAYAEKSHVKSHFPACVDRNGDPEGLTWDHDLPPSKGPRS